MGYFRDDMPLYELLLDDRQQRELDEMWHELDFVAAANIRTYIQFYHSGRREGPITVGEEKPGAAEPGDNEITSEASIKEHTEIFFARAQGGADVAIQAIKDYFRWVTDGIRWVENSRIDAEPSHSQA